MKVTVDSDSDGEEDEEEEDEEEEEEVVVVEVKQRPSSLNLQDRQFERLQVGHNSIDPKQELLCPVGDGKCLDLRYCVCVCVCVCVPLYVL